MKKILSILAVLLILPITVFAATSPVVLTLEPTTDNLIVNYKGTISAGSTAVMCELYDANDEKVDFFSSAVDNGAFEGSVTSPSAATYKLRCANFEGGEIKEVEVTTTAVEEKKDNPTTKDPIYTYIAIGAVALIVIGVVVVFLTKKGKKEEKQEK